ncbi:hypothetical protein HDU78_011692 [Chytriomyces hyalinus]|nr:hypothetical protein HDU78_011692 [Chytriomyces hyalinus]
MTACNEKLCIAVRLEVAQASSSGISVDAVGGLVDDVNIDATLPGMPTAAQLAEHEHIIQQPNEVSDEESGQLPGPLTEAQLAEFDAVIQPRKMELGIAARLDVAQSCSSGVGVGAVGGVVDNVEIDSTLPAMPTAAQLADHEHIIQQHEASKRAVGILEAAMWPTVAFEMVEGGFYDKEPLDVMDGTVGVPAEMLADFDKLAMVDPSQLSGYNMDHVTQFVCSQLAMNTHA